MSVLNKRFRVSKCGTLCRLGMGAIALMVVGHPCRAETITFDDLLASPNTFYSGDLSTVNNSGWTTGGVEFRVGTDFPPFWRGWSQSNVVDPLTPGPGNQYASAPGGGSDGSGGVVDNGGYAVVFGDSVDPFSAFSHYLNVPVGMNLYSVDWTNTTYARFSLRDGNQFAKPFGGVTGTDPDFFEVDLIGYSEANLGGSTTGTVTLTLADYRDPVSANDYIVEDWQIGEDLTMLGGARSVAVEFSSSDTSNGFINQPTYFAIDNLTLTAVPEPGVAGLALLSLGVIVMKRRRR